MENICQATVVAPGGMVAEALSKPAFILSREELGAVLKLYPGSHTLRLEGACAAGSTRRIDAASSRSSTRCRTRAQPTM